VYPLPADELVVDRAARGAGRRFLSGPLEFGPALLITPSCSLGAQGATGYGHAVRTLVPVIPIAELVSGGIVKETALADLRHFDHLINYKRGTGDQANETSSAPGVRVRFRCPLPSAFMT